jgi:hypothetical protein
LGIGNSFFPAQQHHQSNRTGNNPLYKYLHKRTPRPQLQAQQWRNPRPVKQAQQHIFVPEVNDGLWKLAKSPIKVTGLSELLLKYPKTVS